MWFKKQGSLLLWGLPNLNLFEYFGLNKPVGDWISAPSQNLVAMATRVSPTTFCMVPLNWPSPKTPCRSKHFRSICHTSRLVGDFVQILGSKFRGLNQKLKNNVLYRSTWRNDGQKWLDSIEKKKKQFEGAWQTEGQTESTVNNNRLLGQARRSTVQILGSKGQHP